MPNIKRNILEKPRYNATVAIRETTRTLPRIPIMEATPMDVLNPGLCIAIDRKTKIPGPDPVSRRRNLLKVKAPSLPVAVESSQAPRAPSPMDRPPLSLASKRQSVKEYQLLKLMMMTMKTRLYRHC
jgi:hypothetical protein